MDNGVKTIVIPAKKIVCDFILLLCVGFPILFLFLWGDAYKRGFFCDDDSLKHPYQESTIPSKYLYIFGIGMPVTVMLCTEYLLSLNEHSRKEYLFCGNRIPPWIFKSYCVIGVFFFGAACSQLSTDIMKYTIGRLRPHFFPTCVPSVDCQDPNQRHIYHIDFVCTNPQYIHNRRIMKELRLSFPSGHSSFSMYSMLYFSIYLQARMTWIGSKLLRHTLQFLAITSSLYTAMTRVSDYKHHWSDVLTGLLIGATTASVVACYIEEIKLKKPCSKCEYQAILP